MVAWCRSIETRLAAPGRRAGRVPIASLYQTRASSLRSRAAHASPSWRMRSALPRAWGRAARWIKAIEPIDLASAVAHRSGGFVVARKLERGEIPEERLAILGIKRHTPSGNWQVRMRDVSSSQSQSAPEPCQQRIVGAAHGQQPIGLVQVLAIEREAWPSSSIASGSSPARVADRRLGVGGTAHPPVVFRECQPRTAIQGSAATKARERLDRGARLPRIVAQQAPVKRILKREVGEFGERHEFGAQLAPVGAACRKCR